MNIEEIVKKIDYYFTKLLQLLDAIIKSVKEGKIDKRLQYPMFFLIVAISFYVIFWLCNFPKLKETYQAILISAASIGIAEYFNRKYFY